MSVWIAPERLYLDAAGRVVTATDPARARLLVGKGLALPMTEAIRLGLVTPAPPPPPDPTEDDAPPPFPADPEPDTKQQAAPPADKMQRGPRTTKRK